MSRQQVGRLADSGPGARPSDRPRPGDSPRPARRPRRAGDPTILRRPRADRSGRHHRLPQRPIATPRPGPGPARGVDRETATSGDGATNLGRRDTVEAADVARIATEAAGLVPGVASAHSATVRLGGRSVGLDLRLVTTYGRSVPAVAEAVRTTVAERVATATGLTVAAVTVTVDDLRVPGADGAATPRATESPANGMRTVNRAASLALSVALLVGGTLVAVQALLVSLRLPEPAVLPTGWYDTLTTTGWHDPDVRTVAVVTVLLGLVVLAAQLRRWTPVRLHVGERDGWYLRRRCVERRLARAAGAVPGVRRARVRIRQRGDRWHPRVRATGDPAARAEIEYAVHQELRHLASPRPDRVEIRLLPHGRPA
ncbi:Asp23/Gls24 family envelope stress response protein [Micromonospora sp. NPDC005298]|uniref:Asp23/Gls24 family envelope stress response protein n=1 Tax=Micromonospora sp. NPDC005298 TaxID=3156873 RepID=UPI0033BEC1C9